MSEKISFTTIDDVTIVGDWMAAPTTLGAVILVHMMPSNRTAWAEFQPLLAKRGLASLAIDLRGHGESLKGPGGAALDFKNFSDSEHESSIYDVLAASEWIARRGFEKGRIAVVGASFGANLAAQLLIEDPHIAGAALLSPGQNYHGTDVVEDAGSLGNEQALWIAASEGDDQESFVASKAAFENAPCEKKFFLPLRNAGHGTKILSSQANLSVQLADWLKQIIQGV